MGLSSFPVVSSGWLPILVINAVLSIAVIRDIWRSVVRMIGFGGSDEGEPTEAASSSWSYAETIGPCASGDSFATVEEIRDSIPVARFASNGNGNTECAVCLSKFDGGEEIRRLPCRHVFHKGCLDKWLEHDRMTCPLCRLCVVPEQIRRRRGQHLTEEVVLWF